MAVLHRAVAPVLWCVGLGILTALPAPVRAQDLAPAGRENLGEPPSTLVLEPTEYFATAQAWIASVEASSLDPTVPQILAAGRSAASQQDWVATSAAVQHLTKTRVPPGMVTLLEGLIAGGRGDRTAQLALLGEAAPQLAAGGEREIAVETWRFLGAVAAEQGLLTAAGAFLTEALRYEPDHAGVLYLLGRVALTRGDVAGGVAALEHTVALAPEDPVAWFGLSEAYHRIGRAAAARDAAETAIRSAPGWGRARVRLARWRLDVGDAQGAFNALLPLAGRMGDAPAVRDMLREATRGLGGTRAFRHQAAALRAREATPEEWAALGRLEREGGALENAVAAYRTAVTLDPGEGEYGFVLGGLLAQMWDVRGAMAAYEQALAAGFSAVACHFNLGLLYTLDERYDAAIVAFDASEAAGGIPWYVRAGKGEAQFRAGRTEAAAATLSEALSLHTTSPVLWTTYGRILMAQGLPQAARDAFQRAVEQQEEPTRWVQYWLGRAEFALNRPQAALVAFRAEYVLSGSSSALGYWAGRAAQAAQRPGLAELTLSMAMMHDRGMADGWRVLAELDQARGDLQGAQQGYARARALGLDSALLYFRLGELALVRGNLSGARDWLTQAVNRDATLTEAWQRLGAAQAELGEGSAARQSFAHAYGQGRMAWFVQRSLLRFFLGALWIAGFMVCLNLGSRFHRPKDAWTSLFRARLDLAVVTVLALLLPLVLMLAGQRLIYASFQLQRLANRQAIGFNLVLALRDGLFLGALPLLYFWWRHGRPRVGPLRPARVARHVLLGVAACAAFAAPGLLAHFMEQMEQDVMGAGVVSRSQDFFNATPQTLVTSVFAIGVVSSVAQEMFYRGVVFRLSRDQVGAAAAGVLSALLFAAFHFQAANFWWYLAFGLLAAALYHRTKSLVAPIAMHVLYNVVQVIV